MNITKQNRRLSLLIALTAAGTCFLMAQQARHQQPSSIQVRVLDGMTGFVIDPDQVMIDAQPATRLRSENGTVTIGSPLRQNGRYRLSFRKIGYKDIDADASDVGDVSPITVLLTPIEPPPELADLPKLLRSDATAIVGFVSDEKTGHPLSDVSVHALASPDYARTNERGFFALYLPKRAIDQPELVDLLFEKAGFSSEERHNVELAAGDLITYTIALSSGQGNRVIDDDKFRRHEGDLQEQNAPENASSSMSSSKEGDAFSAGADVQATAGAPIIPATIRVGTNCPTTKTCKKVVFMSLDDYCKHVLPQEWFPSWNDDSLKAGAVAVRTYGAFFVQHPLAPSYDICDNIACQAFNPGSTHQYTSNAVDYSAGVILLDRNGDIPKSEYASETNNFGCGQGSSGEPPHYPCLSDSVCANAPRNGHGRGMCQRGSHRWASALVFDHMQGSTPIDRPGTQASQNWLWILNHYYVPNGYRVNFPPTWNPRLVITTAPDVEPKPYKSSAGDYYTIGQSLTASFSVKSLENVPVTIADLVFGGRMQGQDCVALRLPCPDFKRTTNGPITLQPGIEYRYSGIKTFDTSGQYSYSVYYKTRDDAWHWGSEISGNNPITIVVDSVCRVNSTASALSSRLSAASSCTGPMTGTINISANKDNGAYAGPLSCTLTTPTGVTLVASVPFSLPNAPTGSYSIACVAPAGTQINSILPSSSQTLSPAGTATFAVALATITQPPVTVYANPLSTPPNGVSWTWSLSSWQSSGSTWITQPVLTFYGSDYRFSHPQGYIEALKQLKNLGATGPLDLNISQFQAVLSFWTPVTVVSQLSNVSCSATPNPAQTGQTVTFAANWTGGSGSPGFNWTGYISGTTRSVTTSYTTPGDYPVNVLVIDNGQQVSASCSVTVQPATTTVTVYANPLPTPPAGVSWTWSLSAWQSSGSTWLTQPVLNFYGTDYRYSHPQGYIEALKQLKNWGATGPLDLNISQFQAALPFWPPAMVVPAPPANQLSLTWFTYAPASPQTTDTITLQFYGGGFSAETQVWVFGLNCVNGCQSAVVASSVTNSSFQALAQLQSRDNFQVKIRNGPSGAFVLAGTVPVR